jgi:translation initiation factor 3 subunit A
MECGSTPYIGLGHIIVVLFCYQVKIDHQSQSLRFGTDIGLSRYDTLPEGPVIQTMPSKLFSSHLTAMAQALYQASLIVCSQDLEAQQELIRQKVLKKFSAHEQSDHKIFLKRKQAIEERKEYLENVQKLKEMEERTKEEKKELELRQERRKILEADMKREEEEKKKKDVEDMKRKIAEDKLESLKKTPLGARAFADVTAADLKDLDPNDIMAKQLQQMEKERREKDMKLKGQEKRVDYFERAKRLVEIPLLEKQYKEQIEQDKQFHEEMEEERVTKGIKEHEDYQKTRARLVKMKNDSLVFLEMVNKRRNEKLNVSRQ